MVEKRGAAAAPLGYLLVFVANEWGSAGSSEEDLCCRKSSASRAQAGLRSRSQLLAGHAGWSAASACARGERCGSEAKLRSVVMLLCRQGHSDRAAGTLLTQVFHTPCCLLVLAFHAAGRCFLTLTVVLCSLGCSVAAVAAQRAGQQNHCC